MSDLELINSRIAAFEEKLHQAYSNNVAAFVIKQLRENLNYLKEKRTDLIKTKLVGRPG